VHGATTFWLVQKKRRFARLLIPLGSKNDTSLLFHQTASTALCRSLISPKGMPTGLNGTARGEQCHHENQKLHRLAQTCEPRSSSFAQRLFPDLPARTTPFVIVDGERALSHVACFGNTPGSGNIGWTCPSALRLFAEATACQWTLACSNPPDFFSGSCGSPVRDGQAQEQDVLCMPSIHKYTSFYIFFNS
jgi:hypothetical protein